MFVYRRNVKIQWGDCDPANIVFFPRYYEMFDANVAMMFEAAGYPKKDIIARFGVVGWPIVEMRTRFLIPSTFGDEIVIESRVETWHRASFEIVHKALKGDALAIEAHDTRVLVGPHPDDPSKLKSTPVPEEIVSRFRQG